MARAARAISSGVKCSENAGRLKIAEIHARCSANNENPRIATSLSIGSAGIPSGRITGTDTLGYNLPPLGSLRYVGSTFPVPIAGRMLTGPLTSRTIPSPFILSERIFDACFLACALTIRAVSLVSVYAGLAFPCSPCHCSLVTPFFDGYVVILAGGGAGSYGVAQQNEAQI